jgi:inward rectifier potassium channel
MIARAMAGRHPTRVFAQQGSGVVTIGLKRRPVRDLYHWLVTGSWTRLVLLFAAVHLATQALFGFGVPALLDALRAEPTSGARAFSARGLAAAALHAAQGFVQWAEAVLGAGIVLAKFSLVRARVLFSRVAVVGPHEGGRALSFRMANERTSHIVDARVSVMLVRNEVQGGEVVRKARDLELARQGSALFSHAWTAIHPITQESPLSGESADSLEDAGAEIIVNLSGFDEALVKTVHARHVYPASRIRWNARFRDIMKSLPDGRRAVDYGKFHKTAALDEPSQVSRERTPTSRKAR